MKQPMTRCNTVQQLVPVGLTTLLLISSSLQAQEQATTPQRSFLFSVGQASQSVGNIGGQLDTLGYRDVSISDDKKANAWSVGYRHPINTRWSADIQYLQQGKTTPTVQAALPLGKTQTTAAQDTADALPKRGQGVSAIALYHHPLTRKLSLQAGLGAFVWRSERTATVGTSTYTRKKDGVSPVLQLGLSYRLPTKLDVRFEAHWQHTVMPEEAVDRIGVGIAVGF